MSLKALDLEFGELHPPAKVRKYFGVSIDQLRRWCADGTVEAINIGTPDQPRYRIAEATVRAWIRTHTVSTAGSVVAGETGR